MLPPKPNAPFTQPVTPPPVEVVELLVPAMERWKSSAEVAPRAPLPVDEFWAMCSAPSSITRSDEVPPTPWPPFMPSAPTFGSKMLPPSVGCGPSPCGL